MKKNKKEYSKKLCDFCVAQFIIVLILSLIGTTFGLGVELFPYLIPASAAIVTAALGFYFTKAKAENLSKQKLRNVVLKLALEEKITDGDYYEIIEEIENIDTTVEAKLASMYEDAISEETNTEVI
jgi:hypothetical protein